MKPSIVERLCCPDCRSDLKLHCDRRLDGEIVEGTLDCCDCHRTFEITRFIPRFVPPQTYADNFGFQWNRFRRTQLDSYSGQPISRERFFRQSGWTPCELKNKWVLDVGCGAGRFTEIALSCGSNVVAVDYSSAVDACYRSHNGTGSLHVVQGDIYRLPLQLGCFDFVYCFGVLQHTPRIENAFHVLPSMLRPGGKLSVDVYPKLLSNTLWPKYWLRTLTKHLPAALLFNITRALVNLLLPLSRPLGRLPAIGRKLRYALPVINYEGVLPLSPAQQKEWSLLDTFDMLSARYDQPQSVSTLKKWFTSAGLKDVEVFRSGQVIGRGRKRLTADHWIARS